MKLAFQSKNQIVYNTLLAAIVHGHYRPDQHLIIDELATQMEVSTIPIREALRQLEADSFVVFEPHIGFSVAPIHADLVAEVFNLLEATEVFSSRRACELMSANELAHIEEMIRAMDLSVEDPARWTRDNKALHQFICECGHTTLVKATMRKVIEHWDRLQTYYFTAVLANRIRLAQKEHWEILAAIQTRDPDAVERVIREHNRAALAAYLAHLQPESGDTDPAPLTSQ